MQGVGFRAACAHAARPLPVTGWVRNEPDGAVLLEAQGSSTDLDALLEAIATRMTAHIDASEVSVIPEIASERLFEIRR